MNLSLGAIRDYVRSHLFVWVIAVVTSVGCGYQAFLALRTFLDYPSVVSSTYVKEAADFPGVTVCPENWYNLSLVCSRFPQNCTRKDVLLVYAIPKVVTMGEFRAYGRPHLETLFDCRMTSRSETCQSFDCVEFIRSAYFKVPVLYCFVFDANQLPKRHVFHDCPTPWLYGERKHNLEEIGLHWNESYMLSFLAAGSIPVYVHQSRTNPPVSIEAISMFPDKTVEASITQQRIVRLPRPFRPQCRDYEREVFRSEWGGYHTHAGCIQECEMRTEQKVCNCTLSHHEYSGLYVDSLCAYQLQKRCTDALTAYGSHQLCEKACHLGCSQTTYDVRLTGISQNKSSLPQLHHSALFLSFASSSVEQFQYIQAVGSDMTIGYISGYIGVWTGASFHGLLQYLMSKMHIFQD